MGLVVSHQLKNIYKTTKLFAVASALVLVGFATYQTTPKVGAAPFVCTTGFYQTVYGQLHTLDAISGEYEVVGSSIQNSGINAIGYNTEDNHIYGVMNGDQVGSEPRGSLIRFEDDGTYTSLGVPTGFDDSVNTVAAGTFDDSGNLWVVDGSSEHTNTLQRIDVSAGTSTVVRVGVPLGVDIVYADSVIYGVEAASNTLTSYDIASDTVTQAVVAGLPVGGFGAAWYTGDGKMFFSHNSVGNIYEISGYDTLTPTAEVVLHGQVTSNNDGTSCPQADSPLPVEIVATDDDYSSTPISAGEGGTVGNIFDNDTINGENVVDRTSDITLSVVDDDGLTGVEIDGEGTVTVPVGTTPGTYEVEYEICQRTDPNNCDTAIITIVVEPSIEASDDNYASEPVPTTGGTVGNILDNDNQNGLSIDDPSDVVITVTDEGGLTGVEIDEEGNVIVPAGTEPGTYTVTYQICLVSNPDVCDTATITIVVGDGATPPNTGMLSQNATPLVLSVVAGSVLLAARIGLFTKLYETFASASKASN